MKIIFSIILILQSNVLCFCQSGWIRQTSGISTRINSIHFENSLTGWCVGNGGKILKTTNGGTVWIQQVSGFNDNFMSVWFTSVNTGYVVNNNGIIIRTTNSGIDWLQIFETDQNFYSITFINDTIGFAGGTDGNNAKLYKTENAGTSWDSVNAENAGLITSICFINPTTGWIAGDIVALDVSMMSKTTNAGNNWSIQISTSTSTITTVFFVDSLYGWLGSLHTMFGPYVSKTTNGGVNWISNNNSIQGNSLYFIDRNKGWAASKLIYNTSDGGDNWIPQTTIQPGIEYRSVYFADSLTGWVAGDSGRILKTTNGGILTNFTNSNSEVPDGYSLSQNYPNPFNPKTVISYELPITGFVSLKVYDVLGNEVAALVNQKQNAGKYEAEFDGSDLSSGMYFYRLVAEGNISDTKTMILLK